MKIFSYLYQKTMSWAKHRRAPYFLAGLSFAESSFFPIPPDVMLAPMCLARPERAWFFAGLTTAASVLGGLFGYAIGLFAFALIEPFLQGSSYWDSYQQAVSWFRDWGFWAVFVAGFSPIPYKVFTIAAGALVMPFFPFFLASFVGRGLRFFLVAGLMRWGGTKMQKTLHNYVDHLGWGLVFLVLLGAVLFKG